MHSIDTLRDGLWAWVVGPAFALGALVLTFLLRAPQAVRLREGFRACFADDATAGGVMPPATAVVFSLTATWGSAAAVSAATAVALGGAGALAWLWLFGALLLPVRYAETLLARSAPPGQAGRAARGTLGARLSADPSPILRALGQGVTVLLPIAALAWVGGAHGGALMDASAQLSPGNEGLLTIGVAVLAGVLAWLASGRAGTGGVTLVGWFSVVAVLALLGVSTAAILHEPSRALGGIPRAFEDAFAGAEGAGAFSGALAGEIAGLAVAHVLPPMLSTLGLDGALQDAARARTSRLQASASMMGPLMHVVLATVLGLSFIATGAFHRRVPGSRTLAEVTFWRSAFETVSQRQESDRAFTGTVRVLDGEARARPLEVATERGTITSPRYVEDGRPADFAVRIDEGHIVVMLEPDNDHTLRQMPASELEHVRVEGRMLPRGASVVTSAMERGGGDLATRLALVALLALGACGAAAWGVGASRHVEGPLGFTILFFPALGLLLAASGTAPWLGSVGSLVSGALATISLAGIVGKARELARLVGPSA